MYDESSSFVLGCTIDDSMTGNCLLTSIENSHRMDFDQMNASRSDRRIMGVISSDWLTGLSFLVTNFHNREPICAIQ